MKFTIEVRRRRPQPEVFEHVEGARVLEGCLLLFHDLNAEAPTVAFAAGEWCSYVREKRRCIRLMSGFEFDWIVATVIAAFVAGVLAGAAISTSTWRRRLASLRRRLNAEYQETVQREHAVTPLQSIDLARARRRPNGAA